MKIFFATSNMFLQVNGYLRYSQPSLQRHSLQEQYNVIMISTKQSHYRCRPPDKRVNQGNSGIIFLFSHQKHYVVTLIRTVLVKRF